MPDYCLLWMLQPLTTTTTPTTTTTYFKPLQLIVVVQAMSFFIVFHAYVPPLGTTITHL